ncbi:hypothetical protein GALMADRAFT_149032 [Galerina marginata CBS 339.88]|uniref:Uncharacterized protein n=1 Tax=Galerina marginata (strain CBS 339.88) TaxID=685588 RepID=A0A067SE69_GALM3|nr:hypothetical protein GALMADRAFT_149032 [Galerina marginata CBS 339.88]
MANVSAAVNDHPLSDLMHAPYSHTRRSLLIDDQINEPHPQYSRPAIDFMDRVGLHIATPRPDAHHANVLPWPNVMDREEPPQHSMLMLRPNPPLTYQELLQCHRTIQNIPEKLSYEDASGYLGQFRQLQLLAEQSVFHSIRAVEDKFTELSATIEADLAQVDLET